MISIHASTRVFLCSQAIDRRLGFDGLSGLVKSYFSKSMLNDKEGCNQALSMFQALYEIERTAKELELSTDAIRQMREQEAVPLLEKFHGWLQQQYAVAQPKSSFGKALFYCLNNWIELKQYVKDGELKIDNNHTAREMKYVSMGVAVFRQRSGWKERCDRFFRHLNMSATWC